MFFQHPHQKTAGKNRKNRKIENRIIFSYGVFIFMIAYQFSEQTVQNPETTFKKTFLHILQKTYSGTVFEGKPRKS